MPQPDLGDNLVGTPEYSQISYNCFGGHFVLPSMAPDDHSQRKGGRKGRNRPIRYDIFDSLFFVTENDPEFVQRRLNLCRECVGIRL